MSAAVIFTMARAIQKMFRMTNLPRASQFAGSAFNFVCVKIPLWNGACYDKSDSTFFYCLRLNKVPNEFISHEFLLIVLNIGLTLSIKSL